MPTQILKILTEHCDVLVDDDRMTELKQRDFPLWAFKMFQYLRAGLPLLTLPSELLFYLLGNDEEKLTLPIFATTNYTVSGEQTSVVVSTGLTGYEYAAANVLSVDRYGDFQYTPASIQYDAESGVCNITFPEAVADGTEVEIDLYKDGAFAETLSYEVIGVMAKAFQLVWETRFINNWLSNVPKIEDASCFEQNRANKENADTARYQELKSTLDHAMRRLDENSAFRTVVLGKRTGF